MFGLRNLFLRPRKPQPRSTPRHTARPWLEQLERRDVPSGPGGGFPTTVGGQGSSTGAHLTLTVTMDGLKSVTLSGNVTNTFFPSSQEVDFTGAATGTTYTDASGHYSLTLNANNLGVVSAVATDLFGGQSDTASATIACAGPIISAFGASNQGGNVLFAGLVAHFDVATGMVVTITGALSGLGSNGITATTAADGSFGNSIVLGSGEQASVTATVIDCWGQSATATCFVC
jgi:hypothetical protein